MVADLALAVVAAESSLLVALVLVHRCASGYRRSTTAATPGHGT